MRVIFDCDSGDGSMIEVKRDGSLLTINTISHNGLGITVCLDHDEAGKFGAEVLRVAAAIRNQKDEAGQ